MGASARELPPEFTVRSTYVLGVVDKGHGSTKPSASDADCKFPHMSPRFTVGQKASHEIHRRYSAQRVPFRGCQEG